MTQEESLELGLAYIKKKEWQAALHVLNECEKQHRSATTSPLPPRLLSALGVSLAMAENKIISGLNCCELAVEAEVFRPELHYHLGLVHLKNGNKRDAISAFNKGLKFNKSHSGIILKLRQLGVRKKRPIRVLPRKHFLNKVIGKVAGS
ncbi:MAG: tetratricopeptide repeat protein [Nitrospirae bacterium]|nr:tetratricopeptide repeat protein [Candidatus Manganitrophaceae bacterium]